MARRGGRRGGQGNRGRRSKANRSRSRSTKSSTRSKSTSSRRGGQGNRGKGFGRAKGTVSRKSVGKGLRSVAKAVGKVASKTKGFAGVRSIASSARAAANKVKQARADRSSKQAKYNRRADRLKRQFGLDTRDMRKLKINVDVNRTLNHFGVPQAITKRIPKSIRDFRYNAELGGKFRSPHKLGVREGYRAPNRGGSISSRTPGGIGVARDMAMRPEDWKGIRDRRAMRPIRGKDQQIGGFRPIRGQDQFGPGFPTPRPIRGLPKRRRQDVIANMYENILGRKADQEGLEYWRNESRSGRQSMDSIRQNILRSDEFKGRSEADREAALRGVEQRRYERENPRFGRPHWRGGKPPRNIARPLPWLGRHYDKKGSRPNRRGRGGISSIAATMAARGF